MFFLWLILGLMVIVIIFVTSTVKLELKNLNINIPKINNNFINKDAEIRLKIYLLEKIKIVDIDINKTKFEKIELDKEIKKIQSKLKKDKNNFDLEFLKILKEINIKFEKLNLNIFLGVEDAAVTAILVGVLSGTIGILLRNKIKDLEKQRYEVNPIYQNINILNLEISGIFAIKMRNIINIIFKIIKRRVNKNGRTSDRRPYAYSNE